MLTTLLCGCETWTACRRHQKQLNHFHLRCLWTLLNTRWQDKISNTEVLQKANMPIIITFMRKAQIRWAGYVTHMPDVRIPKQLLYGELFQGKRSISGQRKRFEDSLKVSLTDFSIDTWTWENLAADRPTWRNLIHSAAHVAEDNRTGTAGKARERRKARATSNQQTTLIQMCPTCGRGFHARMGLICHHRTPKANSRKI